MFFNITKKNIIVSLILIVLLIVLAYVTNITAIPNSIILFQKEDINLKPIFGIKLEEIIPVGAEVKNSSDNSDNVENTILTKTEEKKYALSLLGFNFKTITANVLPDVKVKPLGNVVGLKLYTKGVLVVGTSEIKGKDEKIYRPFEEAGISAGDSIIKIDDKEINTTEELIKCVSKAKEKEMKVVYTNGNEIKETRIKPVMTDKNVYKIGLWVRDAVAGVGTLTFYNPDTNSISSLGHGIQDIDTEELVDISSGKFVTADILNIYKGEANNPGKIEGTIDNSKDIGKIYSNTEYGVYGKVLDSSSLNLEKIEEMEIALRKEIKKGKAEIICYLDGERKNYEVEIEKVFTNNNSNNKSMIVKVTDEELLEKTGGIIQGMSGSPIIQDGKFIGALTHVFVTDPKKGYGVFGDMMIKQLSNS